MDTTKVMNSIPLEPIKVSRKIDAVGEAIASVARRAEPGARLPTIREWCAGLGVSRATLDRAMARLERQGVIEREHGRGIFAAATTQKVIGVLLGLDPFRISGSHYYPMLIEQLQRRLADQGQGLQLYIDVPRNRGESLARQHLADDLESGKVQGMIGTASSGPEQIAWLSRQNVAFVSSGSDLESGWRVALNDRSLIRSAVEELLALGCQRIGVMLHDERRVIEAQGNQRLEEFQATLAGHGMAFNGDWVYQCVRSAEEWTLPEALTHEEIGYQLAGQLIEQRRAGADAGPDGLVVGDDMMTRGALVALSNAGVELGSELQIATHANCRSSALRGYEDRLVRVEFDTGDVAGTMLAMLDELMAGRQPSRNPVVIEPACVRIGEQLKRRADAD